MERKGRVDWSVYEQSQFYAAVRDLLKQHHVETPITTSKGRTAFLRFCRDAQVALPENRRRRIITIDNITGDLRQRFIENNILPQDPSILKKGAGKREHLPDPRDQRIVDLTNQLDSAQRQIHELTELSSALRERIHALESQPTPLQFLQQMLVDTFAQAIQKAEDAKKPAFVRPQQEVRTGESKK